MIKINDWISPQHRNTQNETGGLAPEAINIYLHTFTNTKLHLSNTRETRVSGASEEELVFGGFYINTCTWEYKLVSLVFEIQEGV